MDEKVTTLDLSFYKNQAWQQRLHVSPATFKCAMGGFGSGKTWWLFMQAFFLAYYIPKNYGVVIRKTYPELQDTTQKIFLDNIPSGAFKRIEKTKGIYTLHNDSVIIFRAFDKWDKIKNLNIGFFGIDQAEELPESWFDLLMTRFKLNIEVKYEGLLAANPAGKNWIWRRFIKDKDSPTRDKDYECEISTTEGNREWLPKGYIERLKKNLPKQWQARYMNSSFDSFEGLVFFNYEFNKCQLNMTDMKFNTEDFKIIIGLDPGMDAPTGVLFTAFSLKDYTLYIFDELYEPHLGPKEMCLLINKKLQKWGIVSIWKFLIDPHSVTRDMTGTSKNRNSVLKEYKTFGFPFGFHIILADNNVDVGVLRINEMFGNNTDRTHIKTNLNLEAFYSEINEYQWDVSQKEIELGYNKKEKPKEEKDHLMTALKYICLGIPIQWVDEDIRKRIEASVETRKETERRFLKAGRGKSRFTKY